MAKRTFGKINPYGKASGNKLKNNQLHQTRRQTLCHWIIFLLGEVSSDSKIENLENYFYKILFFAPAGNGRNKTPVIIKCLWIIGY